jgi:hypothetical protein
VSTQGLTKRPILSVQQLETIVDRCMLHHADIKQTSAVVWQAVNGIQFLWLEHFVCHKKHEKKRTAKTTQILQQHSRSTKCSVFTSQVCILQDKYLLILHKKIITAYGDNH